MKTSLDDATFAELRRLLQHGAGLAFDDSRRDSLAYSLGERLAATGCADVAAYLRLLERRPDGPEWQALIDEVTIGETHFFRNPPQIEALRRHVLPELIRRAAGNGRRLRVWSAGCSTGEEPYTVAMLLHELLPDRSGWDVRVLGTDVSTRALGFASSARYGARSIALVPPSDRPRGLVEQDGAWVVRPEVRDLVELRRHNLVTEPVPEVGLDLVLCRNVTIYFDRATTHALIERLHGALADGGYLFLGHAETLWQVNDAFTLVPLGEAFVYRRAVAPAVRRPVETRTPDWRAIMAALTKPRTLPLPRLSRETPPATVAAVRTAIDEGRYDDAVTAAGRLSDANPMRSDAHYLRGLALANLGRDREALVALRKAVYVDPEAGFAYFLLAGALERLGDGVAAARSYRAAAATLGRHPEDGHAPELGGRSVEELCALCHRLAAVAEYQQTEVH